MLRRAVIPLSALMFALGGHTASARPLEPEACAKLKAELTALDEKGVRAMLEKGPEAAKSWLVSRDQIRQVRQYLDLLGQMRFRCPLDAPIVVLRPEQPLDPAEAAAAGAPIEAGAAGITLPPGVTAATIAPIIPKAAAAPTIKVGPKEKAVPKKAAVVPPPAGVAAAPSAPAAAPTVPPVVPAKPKPKPKVDDALRPAAPTAPTTPAAPAPSKAP